MKYILALDEGTTSARSVIYDDKARVVAVSQREFTQIYPHPSWVEHDPVEIWETQLFTIKEALKKASLEAKEINAIGITNQRETTIIWDRHTGKPIYNAIVWQCRRTAEICEELAAEEDFAGYVRKTTGLLIDPYFCATKIKWILDNVEGARSKAEAGDLMFGTVETWLIYNLTGGKAHLSDYSNASRTMLLNIESLHWDERILSELSIPKSILPELVASSGVCAYTDESLLGAQIPIAGIAGDQQSSLFGQGCFEAGEAKNTYGTGCFLLMNIGRKPVLSESSLVTTIAWNIDGQTSYALEGSVFTGGAVIQWLRDELNLIENAAQSEELANSVADTAGVYIVPAFTGLGAPHWESQARGIITGITRGASKAHIVRAALESIAYQVRDLAQCLEAEGGFKLKTLMADGGAAANNFLMQFQADIMGRPVDCPENAETTSLGAAFLAGLAVGVYADKDSLKHIRRTKKLFTPQMEQREVDEKLRGWEQAVKGCIGMVNQIWE